jgi:putative hydrolase of the HAD superfamily
MFDVIAFDADDTLWHTEDLYVGVQARFKEMLAPYATAERVQERLDEIELRNLALYGYGIKSFALSLIETAVDLSDGRVAGTEIQQLIDLAKEMMGAEVQLLDHAAETVGRLAADYPLMVITKGDLLDQEAKIARSGLGDYFHHVEIVSDKTPATYAAVLERHRVAPERFLMVGNSLRSDVLPVVALGGRAVHVPYHVTWIHEDVPLPAEYHERYVKIAHLGQLPELIPQLGR